MFVLNYGRHGDLARQATEVVIGEWKGHHRLVAGIPVQRTGVSDALQTLEAA
jgi:hypothetical protein